MTTFYIDTEFNDGKQDVTFLGIPYHKTTDILDLISIGIVCGESNKKYYAISNEFNLEAAWHKDDGWLRANVLQPIHTELLKLYHDDNVIGTMDYEYTNFSIRSLKELLKMYGKDRETIAAEIDEFIRNNKPRDERAQFYGWYSAYDWVAFCQLMGGMLKLPDGVNQHCIDLRALEDFILESKEDASISKIGKYPVKDKAQVHNALYDACWTQRLHNYFKDIQNS